MADLKDKYSDKNLDRSGQAFEDLVSHPDNQALNDQGDAVARDLENAEKSVKTPGEFNEGDGKDAARKAEAKEWNAPENRFGYKPNNQGDAKPTGSTRRKNAVRLGVAGGAIGIVLALFGALLPLKIPGIMQMISDEAGQRVEQITERRAKIIIARAILQKFATSGSGIVVTGGGPVSTLIASMRTNNFEKKLADKGLTIERTSDGVRLSVDGDKLGDGKLLKTDVEVMRALDGHPVSNRLIKDIVKEEIPSWRWMKRAKFAKWLRIKYGIPRYGIPNSDESDSEKAVAEMQGERAKAEIDQVVDNAGLALSCLGSAGEDCALISDTDSATDLKESTSSSEVSDVVSEAGTATAEEAAGENGSSRDLAGFMREKMIGLFASKAIPVIGWIDLAATISHAVREQAKSDFIGKVIAGLKERNYAQLYGNWSGYGSQVQLGAMRPDYIGTLAKQTEGIEEAQAFNYIEGNRKTQTANLLAPTAFASTTSPSEIPGIPVDKINSNNPSAIKEKMDDFNAATNGLVIGGSAPAGTILEGWYQTIGDGGLGGYLSRGLGKVFGAVTPGFIDDWTKSFMAIIGEKIIALMGLDYNPLVSGAPWINDSHGGATASYNTFCRDVMVCRKLSVTQASLQNRTIAAERSDYTASKGVFYALFSPENTKSLTSNLAIRAPTDTASAMNSVASFVLTSPARLLNSLQGTPVSAEGYDGYVDLHGVDPYGATESDLNRPLAEETITGDDCQEVAEGEYNGCTVDMMVAEAMLCEYNEKSEDCSDTDTPTSNTGDSPLTCSAVPSWTKLPGAISAPVGGPVSGSIDMAVANIQKGSGVNSSLNTLTNSKPDFIALNEIGETSLNALEAAAPGYGAYREQQVDGGAGGGLRSMDNALMWRKDKWTFLEGGRIKVTEDDTGYHSGNPFTWDRWAAWGTFKRTDGAIVSVISTHMMTNPQKFSAQHSNPDLTRIQQYKQSMEILIQLTTVLGTHGPVLVGGDMNTHANQGDWSAVPMMRQAGYGYANDGAVVYLFHPKGTRIASQRTIGIASDHPALWAKVDMNGAGPTANSGSTADCASASTGGWAWPLGIQAWKDHRAEFLGSHYTGGGFLGDGNSSVDISWGDDDGLPIYSMLDGVVKQQPLGRSSYRCTGTPNSDNNGGMIVESNVNGKLVQIAYAHGYDPTLNVGDPVKSGQQILKLGNVGNSCGSHLHMDMTYGDKNICLQDIFVVMGQNQTPDLDKLAVKATATCAGRL